MPPEPTCPQTSWLPLHSIFVVGSRNPDKLHEYEMLLGPFSAEVINLDQLEVRLGLPPHSLGSVPEPGVTYEENAAIKVYSIAAAIDQSSLPDRDHYVLLCDDSGIEINCTKWNAPNSNDYRKSNEQLLLEGISDRLAGRPYPGVDTAYVEQAAGSTENVHATYLKTIEANGGNHSMNAVTVIAVMTLADQALRLFRSEVQGHLSTQVMGDIGFGYDFCFIPKSSTKTYAQMSLEEKLAISERRMALMDLLKSLKGTGAPQITIIPQPA